MERARIGRAALPLCLVGFASLLALFGFLSGDVAAAASKTEGSARDDADDPYAARRAAMVEKQIARGGGLFGRTAVRDAAVLDAMRRVPRHRFVSERQAAAAYDDRPLPIGYGQTISQPYIVAIMTGLLQAGPEDRALEIGTGSGYQAAVLAEIVDKVYTIEIVPELAEQARRRLAALGYDNVVVKEGDGYYGWKEHGPFDAIIVTAAASHIPPPLLEQLKPGGRMVIPVGAPFQVQRLMLVEKDEQGKVTQRSVMSVRFVPFTRAGEARSPADD